MQDVLYEVFETDADMLEGKLVHQGYSRDIAETAMVKFFTSSAYEQDYMLVDHNKQEVLCACLSARSISIRGECQS
jgi:hypothetical protein